MSGDWKKEYIKRLQEVGDTVSEEAVRRIRQATADSMARKAMAIKVSKDIIAALTENTVEAIGILEVIKWYLQADRERLHQRLGGGE